MLESLFKMEDVPLKSLMYFWDLNKVALSLAVSLVNKALDEFHIELEVVLVLLMELLLVVIWPEVDLVGSI